jgi:hypothetical protein
MARRSVKKTSNRSTDLSGLNRHAASCECELQEPGLWSLRRRELPLLCGLHSEIRKVPAWTRRCELRSRNIAPFIDVCSYSYLKSSRNGSQSFRRNVRYDLTYYLLRSKGSLSRLGGFRSSGTARNSLGGGRCILSSFGFLVRTAVQQTSQQQDDSDHCGERNCV